MRYMLLIYTPQEDVEGQEDSMQPWIDYTADMNAAGVNLGGDALMPIDTATTVRVRNDETLATDGPFAETKEVLGGYYMIDVADLDDALKWAARCPASGYGSIEVRPIMEIPELPDA